MANSSSSLILVAIAGYLVYRSGALAGLGIGTTEAVEKAKAEAAKKTGTLSPAGGNPVGDNGEPCGFIAWGKPHARYVQDNHNGTWTVVVEGAKVGDFTDLNAAQQKYNQMVGVLTMSRNSDSVMQLAIYGVGGYFVYQAAKDGRLDKIFPGLSAKLNGEEAKDKPPNAPPAPGGTTGGSGVSSGCPMIAGVRYVQQAANGYIVVVNGSQVGGVFPSLAEAQRLYNDLACPNNNSDYSDVGTGWH